MAAETLRIELTPAEQLKWWAGIAIEFGVSSEGNITVYDEWADDSESFGDGCAITIPKRIWDEAFPWIAERLAAIQ